MLLLPVIMDGFQPMKSIHPPSEISSWKTYMNFYYPGIKKGSSNSIC